MGHLARELSYKYSLPVICVEQNKLLSDSAQKYDKQFLQTLKKRLPEFNNSPPYHYCAKIHDDDDDDDYSCEYLTEKIDDIFGKIFKLQDKGFGLCGLHPCGDLASTLLKLYVKQDVIKFISIVGCCYMKLTLK